MNKIAEYEVRQNENTFIVKADSWDMSTTLKFYQNEKLVAFFSHCDCWWKKGEVQEYEDEKDT